MAKTEPVSARVEPEIKVQAEHVLERLGIPMSNAINMFLHQIVIQQAIPFEIALSRRKPLALGGLTKEELDAAIQEGIDDIESGRVVSAESVAERMHLDYDV